MTFVSYSLQEAFAYTVLAVHYSTGIALLPMGSLACRFVKKKCHKTNVEEKFFMKGKNHMLHINI